GRRKPHATTHPDPAPATRPRRDALPHPIPPPLQKPITITLRSPPPPPPPPHLHHPILGPLPTARPAHALLPRRAARRSPLPPLPPLGPPPPPRVRRPRRSLPRRPPGLRRGHHALAAHLRHGPAGGGRLQAQLPPGAAAADRERG